VMLVAMIVIEVTNLSGVVGSRLPIFQASLGMGMLAVAVALRDPTMRSRLNRWTLICAILIGCYLLAQGLSLIGSQNEAISLVAVKNATLDGAFLMVVLLLAQLTGRTWTVAAAFVLPFAAISVLSLINQIAFGGTLSFGGFAGVTEYGGELITTRRYGGPLPDSNYWGRHLVMAVPLAGALLVRARWSGRRRTVWGWAGVLAALLVGVYLTQSRGTLIALGVALVVWTLASGSAGRRQGAKCLPLFALLLLVPGIGDRLLLLIVDVSKSGSSDAVDVSVLGRLAAQETALAMFQERPLFGFGPGVFASLVMPQYAGLVHTAVLHPVDNPHNLYAAIASETGIVGLIGWTVFIGGFIMCAAIRVGRLALNQYGPEWSLAAAVVAALVGWSLASVFLNIAYFRSAAIVLALAGALASAPAPAVRTAVKAARGRIRDLSLASFVGVGAAAVVLAATTTHAYTATQRVTLMPVGVSGGWYAYALDIRSRDVVLPTYAAMMESDSPGVTTVTDVVRGVVNITAEGADPSAARSALGSAVAKAHAGLTRFDADSWYVPKPVGDVEITEVPRRSALGTWGAVAIGFGTAAGVLFVMRRRRHGLLDYRRRHRFGRSPAVPAADRLMTDATVILPRV
jgi:O-antigen ligase